MWFAVDADAVDRAGGISAAAAERMSGIDLGELAEAVQAGMPGARTSAAAAQSQLVLSLELTALVARLTDEGGRLRLAAAVYSAADAVARACATAARAPETDVVPAPAPGPAPGPVGPGPRR